MTPEDKVKFEELNREVEDFTKDMTPEDKAEFESFVPKSEKFVNELSKEDKNWLMKTD